jgi:hypothetical protein
MPASAFVVFKHRVVIVGRGEGIVAAAGIAQVVVGSERRFVVGKHTVALQYAQC